jgi:hypothetical protein
MNGEMILNSMSASESLITLESPRLLVRIDAANGGKVRSLQSRRTGKEFFYQDSRRAFDGAHSTARPATATMTSAAWTSAFRPSALVGAGRRRVWNTTIPIMVFCGRGSGKSNRSHREFACVGSSLRCIACSNARAPSTATTG